MKVSCFLLLLFVSSNSFAQVPAYGSSKTTDIASWNLFWYGHPSYGSTNNSKQRAGVAEVIRNSRVDIWFFQEVVDSSDLTAVLNESGTFGHIYSNYWQDQKIGIAWNAANWFLVSDSQLFPQNPASFASGRLPLFAHLVSLDYADTLFLIGIHLKAHTGTDEKKRASYFNRRESAMLLNQWQVSHPAKKVIIAGDWNDDIDQSNYQDTLSPFSQVMDESGEYLFEKESYAGENSWYYGNSMIDHIWVNASIYASFKPNSQKILPLDWYLNAYPSEVSDNFPIFASFYPDKPVGLSTIEDGIGLYPNPSKGSAHLIGLVPGDLVVLFSTFGQRVSEYRPNAMNEVEFSGLQTGSYFVQVCRGEQVFYYRLVVNP